MIVKQSESMKYYVLFIIARTWPDTQINVYTSHNNIISLTSLLYIYIDYHNSILSILLYVCACVWPLIYGSSVEAF